MCVGVYSIFGRSFVDMYFDKIIRQRQQNSVKTSYAHLFIVPGIARGSTAMTSAPPAPSTIR